MRPRLPRRAAAVCAVVSLVAVGTLAGTGSATASSASDGSACQATPVRSSPHLSVRRTSGGAIATVSVTHGLAGRAELTVRPGRALAVDVSHGSGSQFFATRSGVTYRLVVVFAPDGRGCVTGGSDSATYRNGWVRDDGSDGSRGLGRIALASSSSRPVPRVSSVDGGPDFTTALLGLLGAALVAAAATSIAANHRRNRAGS